MQRGGRSTAAGVSFQATAIARAILDVYTKRVEFVRAEVPRAASLGGNANLVTVSVDDFVIGAESKLRFYQAKMNAPGSGEWTVTKLVRESILQDFRSQLTATPGASCHLVTPNECKLLGEMANNARNSTSAREFQANLNVEHTKIFSDVQAAISASADEMFQILQGSYLEQISFDTLRENVSRLADVLFADAEAASQCLFAIATDAMVNGNPLDLDAVTNVFEKSGVFAAAKMPVAVIEATFRESSIQLRNASKTICGEYVNQAVVDEMLAWINDGAAKNTPIPVGCLLDCAGSGKTTAISALLQKLEAGGWIVLGVKADDLPSFKSANDLVEHLGLTDSIPSAISALVKSGKRVAILIDQLDALSTALSRDSDAIKVVLGVVARLSGVANTAVVVACRSFDWKFDPRLKEISERQPKEFRLAEFSVGDVARILTKIAVDRSAVHPLTLKLLTNPQHLRVFTQIVENNRREQVNWQPNDTTIYTQQLLYSELWDLVLRRAEISGGGADRCNSLISIVIDRMVNAQSLSVPTLIIEHMQSVTDFLLSEGVLARNGQNIRFYHQTCFDFMAARDFVRKQTKISVFLPTTDQGLFYRPLVRQILEFLRGFDRAEYISELRCLLGQDNIRRHIKTSVLQWCGQHRGSMRDELFLWDNWLNSPSERWRAFSCMNANPDWFDLLQEDRFRQWLSTLTDAERHPVIGYLHSIMQYRQKAVCGLLCEYVARNQAWDYAISWCLSGIKGEWESCSVVLLKQIIEQSPTEIERDNPWAWAIQDLAKTHPVKACDLITAALRRFVPQWRAEGLRSSRQFTWTSLKDDKELLPTAYGFWEAVKHCAQAAPLEFVRGVLSTLSSLMDLSCDEGDDVRFRQNFKFWQYGEQMPDRKASEKLLVAAVQATRELAKSSPSEFREVVLGMTAGGYKVFEIAVAQCFSDHPEIFALDAALFLLADSRRLLLGTTSNIVWYSAQLLRACKAYWNAEYYSAIATRILKLKTERLRHPGDLRWNGITQCELLLAIESEQLKGDVWSRLDELKRKFPEFRSHEPRAIRSGLVGSPISNDVLKQLSNVSWLRAMERYGTDRPRNFEKPIEQSGGRDQLASALTAFTTKEPIRFYKLIRNGRTSKHDISYVAAVIRGLSDAKAPIETVADLIETFLGELEIGEIRTMTLAIGKYDSEGMPRRLIYLLYRWTLSASNPKESISKSKQTGQMGSVNEGINTDRGSALWSLCAILLKFQKPKRVEVLSLIPRMLDEPSPLVRAVFVHFLEYAMAADPIKACKGFLEFVKRDETLLEDDAGIGFVYAAVHKHSDEVLWAIEKLVFNSQNEIVRKSGAKLACLAVLHNDAARDLFIHCENGDAIARAGIAAVFAANINSAGVSTTCRNSLPRFWRDDDETVRDAANEFIHHLVERDFRDAHDFLLAWSSSPAFGGGATEFARSLKDNCAVNPSVSLELAERLVTSVGSRMVNVQLRDGMVPFYLFPALTSIYHCFSESSIRARTMDIFEKMEELGCDVRTTLESVDRL